MKKYVTEIKAINPLTNEMATWAGPNVPGKNFEDAEAYCQKNELGYCRVVGVFIAEVPAAANPHL